MEKHTFWNNQPIDISKNSIESKIIDNSEKEISKTPLNLPPGYNWVDIDLTNENSLNKLVVFLCKYYNSVEDDDKTTDYNSKFLKWVLMQPNYFPDLIVSVEANDKIVAFICGIPMDMIIHNKNVKLIEINFLCIHPKLRNKRLAPVLIREITRRTNLHNIWTAIYTGGLDLPNCLVTCIYYHRPLNIPKLLDLNFLVLSKNMTENMCIKLFKILDKTTINIRKLTENDCEICCLKFNDFHKKFKVGIQFSLEYFKQHFLEISSYVVETNGIITDFVSFYRLDILIKNNKYTNINKYNLYYYFYFETKLDILVNNALYLIKKEGGDVVNCLDQYDNKQFIDKLLFKEGTFNLNFYLYNWMCPIIEKHDMSLLMV